MDFIGLDIGSRSLKAVQLRRSGHGHQLVSFAHATAPLRATLSAGGQSDLKALSGALSELVSSNFNLCGVVVALPESQIFTRVVTVPKMSRKELETAIRWEAEQYIPVPLNEVTMDWEIIETPPSEGKMSVLLVAAPKVLIEKVVKILEGAGLRPLAIESETTAIVRSAVGVDPDLPTTLAVSIGATTTDLTIVSGGKISFTRSVSTGGNALTRAISQGLGLDISQAEEYKHSYGLEGDQLENKVVEIVKPVFEMIVNEVRRALAFYQSHRSGDVIRRVILVGGSASLPGAVVFLAESLGIEVQLGDPWQGIEVPEEINRGELEELGPSFAVAVGLALKEV